LLAVGLVAAGAAAPLAAQNIAGVVLEGHGQPVVGALLDFLDATGRVERQVLTDSLGAFTVATRDTGRYLIRVSRVGFAVWEGVARAGRTAGSIVVLRASAAPLSALTFDSLPAVCGVPPAASPASRLIAEGHTALTIVRTTYATRLLALAVEQYERRLNRQRRAQDSTVTSGVGGAWPLTTFPEARLRTAGFVLVRADETFVYAGPGPESLFSDWFVERHCWRVVGSPGGGDVALDFTPRGADGLLSGRLLFDRASGALRSAEWLYERMPSDQLRRQATGSFALERLPSGPWYVRAWQLRIPMVERDSRGSMRVTGYVERGGRVVQVLPGHDDQPGDR
jgi:hypothetical protein